LVVDPAGTTANPLEVEEIIPPATGTSAAPVPPLEVGKIPADAFTVKKAISKKSFIQFPL
jgi:hypothetical protein